MLWPLSKFVCLKIWFASCVFKYFRFILKLEELHNPPGVQLEISSKNSGKNILFWDENITYLEGGRGGTQSLNQKKIDPR